MGPQALVESDQSVCMQGTLLFLGLLLLLWVPLLIFSSGNPTYQVRPALLLDVTYVPYGNLSYLSNNLHGDPCMGRFDLLAKN